MHAVIVYPIEDYTSELEKPHHGGKYVDQWMVNGNRGSCGKWRMFISELQSLVRKQSHCFHRSALEQ